MSDRVTDHGQPPGLSATGEGLRRRATQFHLFEVVGIELEYMIVEKTTLDVRPLSDQLLRAVTGAFLPDYEKPGISWSNELALHVIELKTSAPAPAPAAVLPLFQADVSRINQLLGQFDARLMPGGAHPWMDPFRETRLWPHAYNAIYENYHRIFDCRGHGWSNLQSCHLNLPFADDEEFGRLHTAIRVLLPLIPALAASTPIVDGRQQAALDHRLEVYKTNSARIPSLTGTVIPEPIFREEEYREKILQRMYDDIRPLDPAGVLHGEWLNARGAIARFDRSAIEIRIIDVQECPLADLAVADLLIAVLKELAGERYAGLASQQRQATEALAAIFNRVVREADGALIADDDYLALFGLSGAGPLTAGAIWQRLLQRQGEQGGIAPEFLAPLQLILAQGCLARRMLTFLAGDLSRPNLTRLGRRLCDCLAQGVLFDPLV